MNEDSGNRGVWIGLIAAVLALVVFVVLWFMRGSEVSRLNQALQTAQTQASSTSQRLERDLRQVQSNLDASTRRVGELEAQIRDEQRRATEAAQQIERRFRGEADMAASRVRDLTAQLDQIRDETAAEAEAALQRLRDDLAAAREQADQASAESDALRTQLDDAVREAAERAADARDAAEYAAELEQEAARLRQRLKDVNTRLEDAVSQQDDSEETARLTERLAAATTALESLQGRYDQLERARAEADAAARAETRDVVARLESRLAEVQSERDALADQVREARAARSSDERLAELDARAAAAEADAAAARRELADLKEAYDDLADAKETLQLHLEEVSSTKADPGREAPAAASAPVVAPTAAAAAGATTAAATATPPAPARDAEPDVTVIFSPARFIGRVVDAIGNGAYVIDKGRRQGIRTGMRFDVHRPNGEINRFAGVLQVTQPMDDIAVAMLVDDVPLALCPVTGRAFLEPDARYSPYVMSTDRRPVPLITAASVGLDKETPRIGDRIDNPFYDPNRKMVFAVCPELANDADAIRTVEALGCLAEAGQPGAAVDYLLVTENGAFSGDVGGPRRVTKGHVANYVSLPVPSR